MQLLRCASRTVSSVWCRSSPIAQLAASAICASSQHAADRVPPKLHFQGRQPRGHVVQLAFAAQSLQRRCLATATADIPEIEKRRKRLAWRAKSRGWLELDVLMGTFVAKHIAEFGEEKLDLLEEVLDLENPDLFKWFTGQVAVPEEVESNEVMKMLLDYVKSEHKEGLNDR
mmetsp:Transcript_16819/g.39448  ORF Transcript_16819/g.39448 Transcript_16819/m.39448 type:complete len:172 (-) Transcript_16819:89-604(-)